MSKITLRVPTKDQYAFVEKEMEIFGGDEDCDDQIKKAYDELYLKLNSSQKVSDTQYLTDLAQVVDNNLKVEGEGATEWFESLTPLQKQLYSKIRLLVNRAISKYKPEK